MDTAKSRIRPIATVLSSLMGLLGLGGGVYGLMNPVAFSTTIGIPITSASSPALPFMSLIAARNLGSGLSLLVLTSIGQRKAAGIAMMCGVVVAFADVWICARFGALEGKATEHAIMGVVIGALGGALYWT